MCKNIKETNEQDLMALYEELEGRYGVALAQQIVDEVRKSEDKDFIPEYVGAKSLSEALEYIRPQAHKAFKSLKQAELEKSELPCNVASLNIKRAEQNFNRLFGAYILVKSVYWAFYKQIMSDIEKRQYVPKRHVVDMPRNPETATMRKAA